MDSKHVISLVGIVVIIGTLAFVHTSGILQNFDSSVVINLLSEYGRFAPLLFITVYIISTIFLLPATPLTVASGVIFGVWFGTIYVVIGATIGAILAFLYARFLSDTWTTEKKSGLSSRLASYDKAITEHAFSTVLILRLLPIVPFNALNFALGLTSVPLKTYALATGIGIVPGTMAYVYFGHSLDMLTWQSITTAILILVIITAVSWYAKKYVERQSIKNNND